MNRDESATLSEVSEPATPSSNARVINTWFRQPSDLLFGALLLLALLPVWVFEYFPSQDGPAHVNNAMILRHYWDPQAALLREHYVLNFTPLPNLLGHGVLALLMTIFPPLVAEKLLVSAYVVALPVSARYALRAVRPASSWLAVLVFPFIYNMFLLKGTYNFCLGMAMFFGAVGYCWKRRERGGDWRTIAGLTAWGVLLYFTHLLAVATTWLALATLAAWLFVLDLRERRRDPEREPTGIGPLLVKRFLPIAVPIAPAAILGLIFLTGTGIRIHSPLPPAQVAARLGSLLVLVSHQPAERYFAAALATLFAVTTAALIGRRMRSGVRPSPEDGFLVAAVAFVVAALTLPEQSRVGGIVSLRLSPFPYFALLLWIAAQPFASRARRLIVASAVAIFLAMLVMHASKIAQINTYLADFCSAAPHVRANSTILPVIGDLPVDGAASRLSLKIKPFLHAAGYVAAARGAVDLENYEARTRYFPVRLRRAADAHPDDARDNPDYVLLWGDATLPPALGGRYRIVHTSPLGHVRVYERVE